jgi:hypothetical protein
MRSTRLKLTTWQQRLGATGDVVEHHDAFHLMLGLTLDGYLWAPTGAGGAGTGQVRGLPQLIPGNHDRFRDGCC